MCSNNLTIQDCGLNCHEKCREHVPKACTKYKSVAGGGGAEGSEGVGGGGGGGVGGGQDSLGYGYNGQGQNAESRDSNILHKGYLYKRGALLKAWKLRWFQLDTIKHQLVYYDSKEDQFVRAAIDLGEIRNVTQPASLPPGAPKKADERSVNESLAASLSLLFPGVSSTCTQAREPTACAQRRVKSRLTGKRRFRVAFEHLTTTAELLGLL